MFTRGLRNFPAHGLHTHFGELDRMRRHLDQIFGQLGQPAAAARSAGVFPLVNLTETQDAYIVRAEIPGVAADKLDIQTMGRNLTISGERQIEVDPKAKYHRRERESGRFSRAIALPGDIDREKVSATLKNGVLELTVPKAQAAKPRKIEIK